MDYVGISFWTDKGEKPKERVAINRDKFILSRIITGAKKDEVVHHKDRNPLNNARENLEVMSRREHERIHGRIILTEKNVEMIRVLLLSKEFQLQEIGNLFGVAIGTIKDIKHGRTWKDVQLTLNKIRKYRDKADELEETLGDIKL